MGNVDGSSTDLTGQTPARSRRRLPRRDLVIAALLYVVALVVYSRMVVSANHQGLLTGEEASVSFVDVVAIAERFQYTHYSTNFGGHLIYWLSYHLSPFADLFYGRWAKAVILALFAPLVYLTLRRRLSVRPLAAVIGSALAVVLPGVASFSWLATENGLESVVGLIGLLVVTSRRSGWWSAPLLAGFAVSVYGGGIPWAAAIAAAALVRALTGARRVRDTASVAGAGLVGLGIIAFPLAWWGGGAVVTGGGGEGSTASPLEAYSQLAGELAIQGDSYYYFNVHPALSTLALALLALAALVWTALRRRSFWPWLTVLVLTVAVYGFTGGILGVRRTTAIPLIAAMAIAVVVDEVLAWVARRGRFLTAAVALVAAGALIIPPGLQLQTNRVHLSGGATVLPVDFPFRIEPGTDMRGTLELVAQRLRDGADWDDLRGTWEGERTSAILVMLQDKGTIDSVPVTSETVEMLYRTSDRCELRCL